jgi:hypothetical protein
MGPWSVTRSLRRRSLAEEGFHFEFGEELAVGEALADHGEGFVADAVHAAAGFEDASRGLRRPARFEGLDELGGADHLDAQAADQLDGAAVHHGDVGDGAHGGILHGDRFMPAVSFWRASTCSVQLE